MIGGSWRLWVEPGEFPRVPFVGGWPAFPAWVSWACLGAIVAGLAAGAIGRGGRAAVALSMVGLAFAVAGDQNRLQPWVYQYLVVGSALVAAPRSRAPRMARLYAASLYFYSGLSKLDASFVAELGEQFLRAGVAPLGLDPAAWPSPARAAAILAMPAWEVAVAVGLMFRATRRLALVGALAQHAALVAILGPWNLDHSVNVLIWNAAMAAEAWFLFRGPPAGDGPASIEKGWPGAVAWVVVGPALVAPLGERSGLCDSWPGHALYASHCERTDVFLHEDDLDRFPGSARRRVGPPGPGPWRRLDLGGWSLDLRGAPIYPQGRVGNGIAEALAARFGGSQPVRVVQWGRAAFRDGRRSRDECLGLRAIRRRGDLYRINAHPAGRDAGR